MSTENSESQLSFHQIVYMQLYYLIVCHVLLIIYLFKIYHTHITRKKAEDGGGYLTSRCAAGHGSTTHTPEAGEVKLQPPDSLGVTNSFKIKKCKQTNTFKQHGAYHWKDPKMLYQYSN